MNQDTFLLDGASCAHLGEAQLTLGVGDNASKVALRRCRNPEGVTFLRQLLQQGWKGPLELNRFPVSPYALCLE